MLFQSFRQRAVLLCCPQNTLGAVLTSVIPAGARGESADLGVIVTIAMNYFVHGGGGEEAGLLPEYTTIVGAWVLDTSRSVTPCLSLQSTWYLVRCICLLSSLSSLLPGTRYVFLLPGIYFLLITFTFQVNS